MRIPKVMGILNVTPDSFFSESCNFSEESIRKRVRQIISEGADIIDVGGCSTKPGSIPTSEKEELERVELGCKIVRDLNPEIPLSVDTFRSSVASMAIKQWNANIVNDVSGGEDPQMWDLVASAKVGYVLTHNDSNKVIGDITFNVVVDLSKKINDLHKLGISDIIVDPGFGFGKQLQDNFQILAELNEIKKIGLPVLVGLSRKSMIYKSLDKKPEDSLIGTVALDAIALEKGADILRVHDVKEAIETVKLFSLLKKSPYDKFWN